MFHNFIDPKVMELQSEIKKKYQNLCMNKWSFEGLRNSYKL